MANRRAPGRDETRDEWAAKIAALSEPSGTERAEKAPITVGRIMSAAFELVESEGFEALTMRRVAAALRTGPASLYAHVRNKAELDELLISDLCARVPVPVPDPERWTEQMLDICRALRDEYLRYPGISRAALAAAPNSLDALRLSEGMLTVLLTAGVAPQPAAWAIDAAFLYVSAYCFEASLRHHAESGVDQRVLDRDALAERYRMLPSDTFPSTVAHIYELTSGEEHERFEFTLRALLGGLTPGPPRAS
ncbi:TetR/AcrR family transcriptional regulator [Streptomyces kunmingensis]|uniref:TetR/AcrR family transcriptional regulator n=1 Tax=Streptomyces kunmingensis TaxID=68225 RepID=A0ABU6CM67_9ACTN|nr:TetR/AcrR family transcriptional regulator [Streptomyces kunmingensis]MEB3965742.1 TetR/AcrR family transcriptional regulator [Streptomyces kunmingensis]